MSKDKHKRGLGRGLGALIPTSAPVEPPPSDAPAWSAAPATAPAVDPAADPADLVDPSADPADLAAVPGATYAELPLDSIVPNPRQPRQVFDEEALAELVHSIRQIGLLQPVVVRRAGDGFELVAGERRWRACREAGLATIPAIVRDTDDDALLRDALLENLHRAQLNPLEEAAAYSQLLADFGCTQEDLARRLGRSRPQVSNTLRLLRLPPPVQNKVAAGVLSAGHARALLSLDDEVAMERLAGRVVAEGLSVRAVEEIVLVGDADGRARSRTPRPRGPKPPSPELAEVLGEMAARLADRLDTRVTVEPPRSGKGPGRIVVDYADLDDLRRITDVVDP